MDFLLVFYLLIPALLILSWTVLKIMVSSPKRDIGLDLHIQSFIFLIPIIGICPEKAIEASFYFFFSFCIFFINIGFFILSATGVPVKKLFKWINDWGYYSIFIGFFSFLYAVIISILFLIFCV